MFFPERIQSIGPTDLVLEIGPGGTPHPRADIFLEKHFHDPAVARGQRGFAPPLRTSKEIVFYDGGSFPFRNKQFDYVICSHVLEHVENVGTFVEEILRVGKKGYVEYPTIYYDYLYNFPEHITLLFAKSNVLYWMPKAEAGLNKFQCVQGFFYESLQRGYTAMVDELRCFLFQGFEWEQCIVCKRASSLRQLSYTPDEHRLPVKPREFPGKGPLQTVAEFFCRAWKKAL
jgi:SAM-dependent methyltransferase